MKQGRWPFSNSRSSRLMEGKKRVIKRILLAELEGGCTDVILRCWLSQEPETAWNEHVEGHIIKANSLDDQL